jgi:catechol 2,3-dioxygenase-like lactoylglutathione lyase family enzyme
MNIPLKDNTAVVQIAIVVRDIEKTARAFAGVFGFPVPSWSYTAGYDQAATINRGVPSDARAKLAFMHFGALEIELIEPDNEPSTWREFLDEHGEGIHHLAFSVKGMAQHTTNLEALGMPLIMKGEFTGGRYAYFDSNPSLKFILELLEHDKS